MTGLLIIVAVLAAVWYLLWQSRPNFAFALFTGLPVGWLLHRLLEGHLRGPMEDIPVWLPPLPLAIVALILLAYGGLIWFRADEINNPSERERDE